ncbi:Ribonuclease H-like domain,Exonuclease, RNase T/DNA polymerase III [Cinara cedri]|uniref:RNA exonuclease 4 n=1 Tax=Cinara cedri TaxID=506608 RepID=A0A5E4NDB4_9HEMI|nr:Ribonuclease H-like domain,Exonuclease, RNase T/DNA polymerase III [Cinara cedri]
MNKNVASTVHKNANGANNWIKFINASPPPTTNLSNPVVQKHEKKEIEVVAIDCEMVGIQPDGQRNMLARVSIVNSKGETIYDKFVKPTEKVIDYRTPVSGIRPEDIENGETFVTVKREVSVILKNKLLVGHAIEHDLRVLKISHPKHMIRDTSTYWKFKQLTEGRTPGLKRLTLHFLGANIQEGEHSSVQDAKAALQLYMLARKDWELILKKRRSRPRNGNKSGPQQRRNR